MARTTFHRFSIGDFDLVGNIGIDGPYVAVQNRKTKERGDAQIGPCSLNRFKPDERGLPDKPLGWWLVKYETQDRMLLEGLTTDQANAIREEFGLVDDDGKSFYQSRAWLGLVAWTAENSTTATRMARCQTYLPGWHKQALAEATRRGLTPLKPVPKPNPRQRARERAAVMSAFSVPPAPFDIPSRDHAEEAAAEIHQILNVEMGSDTPDDMVKAIAAELMLRDSWSEALTAAGRITPAGRDDGHLSAEALRQRTELQLSGLYERFGIEKGWGEIIIARVRPTGGGPRDAGDIPPKNWPSAERSQATLSGEDEATAQAMLEHVARFDTAARRIIAVTGAERFACTPDHVPESLTRHWGRVSGWTREQATIASETEAEASKAVRAAWRMFAALGPTPHLMPVTTFSLELQRVYRREFERPDFAPRGPIDSEPWMEERFDVNGHSATPTLEWPARRAIRLALGLRRAFLDSGWSGGDPWLVRFQEGAASIETHPVMALTGVEAVAWTCAARAALNEMRQHPRRTNIRIHAVEGPTGAADILACVAGAKLHAITNAPWGGSDRIRTPRSPAGADAVECEIISGDFGKRGFIMRDVKWGFGSTIIILHEDLHGLMERIEVPTYGPLHAIRHDAPPMSELRDATRSALQGEDPWTATGRWGRDTRADIAKRHSEWNTLSKVLANQD